MRFHGKPEDLKSERRKKILPVDVFEREVLGRLKFRRSAIDYGAGVGYFTLPLAKNFEEVYAVEANEEMAELLREELLKAYVNNVTVIVSDEPPDIEADFVLFSNVLHEVDNYRRFLDWSASSKVVCVIEWKDVDAGFGPPVSERISVEEMKSEMLKRFRFVEELEIFTYHYTLLGYNDSDHIRKDSLQRRNVYISDRPPNTEGS